MSALGMSLAACAATAAGGLLALTWRERLRGVLAFGVGTLLGVVALHLLPESLELARAAGSGLAFTSLATLAGLASLHAIDGRAHRHANAAAGRWEMGHRARAALVPAAALIGHSMVDGASIGLAFQVSPSLGTGVALAVVAHDLCDGLNTVALMLARGSTPRAALGLLALNAAAPAVGAAAVTLFNAPPLALALAMSYIAGCLLHIIAFDLLPRLLENGVAALRWPAAGLLCGGLAFAAVVPLGTA